MNPSPPWIRGNACESCRKLKKACCKDPNGCSACKAKGVKCVYPQSITKATQSSSSCSRMATPSQTPLIQIKLPQPSTPSPPQPAFPSCSSTFAFELNQCNLGNNCIKKGPKQLDVDSISTCFTFPPSLQYCIQALDSNLIEKESRNWELVDPDQIPTIDDFQLSYSYLTTNGTTFPCHTPFDAEEFLMNYSQKSAALRLTFCAMAARETGRENLEIHYYRRACKALDRAADGIPSIELLQSYTNLYHFSTSRGQPVVALKFLTAALKIILDLKLDADPDDSPWLFPLNLSERQKEERRRSFWEILWHWSWQRALSNDDLINFDIQPNQVKAPKNIYDSVKIFVDRSIIKWECDILGVIGKIRRQYSIPPKTPLEILVSEAQISLGKHLISSQAAIPVCLLVMSSHPDVVSVEEETMFLSYPAQELVTSLNFMFHASKCVYNRPLLMLSSLPTFRPLTLRSEHRQIISSAIDQCLQSSRRILSLLSFFEDVHSGKRGDRQVPVKARWCYNPLFNQDSLFEAVLVFWFTCCRMNPEWWVYLSSPPLDSLAVHSSLKRSIESLKRQEIIEGSFSGYTTVFKDCMVFMLTDINKSIDTVTQTSGTDMEDLELGMKLTSLDGTIDIDATEETVEPWAFLGLLGVTLPCGIRWKGRSEDSWRLFWKLFK